MADGAEYIIHVLAVMIKASSDLFYFVSLLFNHQITCTG